MSDRQMAPDSWRVRVTVRLYDGSGHRETAWSGSDLAKHDFAVGEMHDFVANQARRRLGQLVAQIGWPKK